MKVIPLLSTTTALVLMSSVLAVAQTDPDFLPQTAVSGNPETGRDVEAPDAPAAVSAPVIPTGPSFRLNDIILEGAQSLTLADLRPIWVDLLGQDVTLADLDDIAARIGATYRARGMVLSQAVLPAQTVADGVVRIQVIEGYIDQVEISGGAPDQTRLAQTLFAPVAQNRPTRITTLERGVLLSRDTFGGEVQTVLEPSPTTFGAANLGVSISSAPTTYFATLDNRGSRLYGGWTLGAGSRSYNLLGLNERIDGLIALAPDNLSLAYGSLTLDAPIESLYGTRLDGGRLELKADISHADPDLTENGSPDNLSLTVKEKNIRAGLIVPFMRTRSQNLYGRAGIGFRESSSETELLGNTVETEDRLFIFDARVTYDRADRLGGVTLFDAAYRQGLDILSAKIGGTGAAAGNEDFSLVTLDLRRLQRVPGTQWSVFGEAKAQYAFNTVPNSERFSLGTNSIGRGFAPGNTSGDSGYGARLEVRRNLTPEELKGALNGVEMYTFADYGQAFDRSADRDGDKTESLGSVGIGARIDVRPWLTITPEVAQQVEGRANDTTRTSHETRFYIGAIARF